MALWIVLFVLLGMYLLGKLRFSHDSETKHVSVPRFFLALCIAVVRSVPSARHVGRTA